MKDSDTALYLELVQAVYKAQKAGYAVVYLTPEALRGVNPLTAEGSMLVHVHDLIKREEEAEHERQRD